MKTTPMSRKPTETKRTTLTLEAASKPDEPALVTALFARRLAQPIADTAVRCGVSANCVTVAGGICWMLSLALPSLVWSVVPDGAYAPAARSSAALWHLWAPWLAAALLWCLGYIFDVADGSVARMTGKSGRPGFLLDYVFHLLFKPAFLFSVGMGLAGMAHCGSFDTVFGAQARRFLEIFIAALAVISIPANGATAMCAAERTLCFGVFSGALSTSSTFDTSVWLGSDGISAPARRKRGSFARTCKTLVAEIASYYLQAPFFALLVVLDFLLFVSFGIWFVPLTAAAFVTLSLAMTGRIFLRFRFERTRLPKELEPKFCALFSWFSVFPALVAAAAALPLLSGSGSVWALAALCTAPLAVVSCIGAEISAAAHVFSQDFGKGKFGSGNRSQDRLAAALAAAVRPEPRITAAAAFLGALCSVGTCVSGSRMLSAAAAFLFAATALALPRRIRITMRILKRSES